MVFLLGWVGGGALAPGWLCSGNYACPQFKIVAAKFRLIISASPIYAKLRAIDWMSGEPLLNGKILAKLCFKPLTDFFGAVCFDPHIISLCLAGRSPLVGGGALALRVLSGFNISAATCFCFGQILKCHPAPVPAAVTVKTAINVAVTFAVNFD